MNPNTPSQIESSSLPSYLDSDLREQLVITINKLWNSESEATVQTDESYDIQIEDNTWDSSTPLIHCPSWYSSILKSIPLSGLWFLAPSPDLPPDLYDDPREEHQFLSLPSWAEVAEEYAFFISELHKHGHYPIASSGYGYLVIPDTGSPHDPVMRWDGSGMDFKEAFPSFIELLRSISKYE